MNYPLDYKIISLNEDCYGDPKGKAIFVGTSNQCVQRILDISLKHKEYAKNLKIVKYDEI